MPQPTTLSRSLLKQKNIEEKADDVKEKKDDIIKINIYHFKHY
jgi:hypothetical protein